MESYLNLLFQNAELISLGEEHRGKLTIEDVNGKDVIIATASELTSEEKTFLSKILTSIKLDLKDVVLVNLKNSPPFHQLKSKFQVKRVVLFGLTPAQLGLNIAHENYQPLHFMNTVILPADSLQTIHDNDSSKTQLWKAMKKIFL